MAMPQSFGFRKGTGPENASGNESKFNGGVLFWGTMVLPVIGLLIVVYWLVTR